MWAEVPIGYLSVNELNMCPGPNTEESPPSRHLLRETDLHKPMGAKTYKIREQAQLGRERRLQAEGTA